MSVSPNLFNILLERIMTVALEDHDDTVSIEGRTNTTLHFAHDISGSAGEKEELEKLVESLDRASTAYSLLHGDQCREDQADNKHKRYH